MSPQEYETIRYACADSDYTLRLYYKFNHWFDRYLPQHRVIVEQLESPTAVLVGIMKYNDIPANKEIMLQKQQEAGASSFMLSHPTFSFAFAIGTTLSSNHISAFSEPYSSNWVITSLITGITTSSTSCSHNVRSFCDA